MAKYMKKPILIEAIEYAEGMEDGFDDFNTAINSGLDIEKFDIPGNTDRFPYIRTLEGKHYISKGDYIITGVDGERYPCKRSIFQKTYTLRQ